MTARRGTGWQRGPAPASPELQQEQHPFLPIDSPPRTSRLPASALVGLEWEADLGTLTTPVSRPWSQYITPDHFPYALPSSVGPAGIHPRYGFSRNLFVSGTTTRAMARKMEDRPARPVEIIARIVQPARGPGRTGRVRGKVAPSPAVNPTWVSMFGNRIVDS